MDLTHYRTELTWLAIFGAIFLPLYFAREFRRVSQYGRPTAMVLVLGDIGHSPRMRYHAQSLLAHQMNVVVVAYAKEGLPSDLKHHRLTLQAVKPASSLGPGWPKIAYVLWLLVKAPLQLLYCFRALTQAGICDIIVMQNPPTIPALMAVHVYQLVTPDSKLIIDWHNYGYTILAMKTGVDSVFTKTAEWYEFAFGRRAQGHFSVTQAMAQDLGERGVFGAQVLYDKPAPQFKILAPKRQSELYSLLVKKYGIEPRITRPKHGRYVLVSGTSWTADEDFSVLLKALWRYEVMARQKSARQLRHLHVIITGRGEGKQAYLSDIKELNDECKFVQLDTVWLDLEDYPRLLSCADIGVSLHKSSSGLDLPMKVVDQLGCGLPVLAFGYPTIAELVTDGQNGRTFTDDLMLCYHLRELADGDVGKAACDTLREGSREWQKSRWQANWTATAWPVVLSLLGRRKRGAYERAYLKKLLDQ